jgi:hypothetical protein
MKQLRGDEIDEAIENGIRRLAKKAGDKYTYNGSQLSREIGISRLTLTRRTAIVEKVLKSVNAEIRVKKGFSLVNQMGKKIERLEKRNNSLKKEYSGVLNHHAAIYSRLFVSSKELADLIKPILQREIASLGHCILCNSKIAKDSESEAGNVRSIDTARNKRRK